MGKLANQLLVLNAEKHAIREAINRKGGELSKAAPLTDYPAAIDAIETGGVVSHDVYDEICRVVFIDYDGTVLKDVYARRGDKVEPPLVPAHEHLSFHGWNREAAKLESVPHDMCVGTLYDIEDGENWLHVNVTASTQISLKVSLSQSGPHAIDWGDGEVTPVTSGGTSYAHTYAADFSGWIKLEGTCIYNMSTSQTLHDKIDEILIAWWNGNIYTGSTSTLRAVCYGVGAGVNSMTLRPTKYFRGFVYGGATDGRAATLSFNSTPGFPVGQFYLSAGEGNSTGTIGGNTPTTVTFPILEELFSALRTSMVFGRAASIVVSEYTGNISLSVAISRLQLDGQTIPGGTLLARTILIKDGAVPAGTLTLDFSVVSNAETVADRLGATETTVTLSLKNVPHALREGLSTALTAKGYTVAFSG